MICSTCRAAADSHAPRDQHCQDHGCTCGHKAERYGTDRATVPLTVVDLTPSRLIATELLDEADAQPSLAPLLYEGIKTVFGDPFADGTTEERPMSAYDDLTPAALQLMADYTELDIVQIAADQSEAITRVQELHHEVMYRDMAICAQCSAWDGPGCGWTEKPPVAYPCATIQALTSRLPEPPKQEWSLDQTCSTFSEQGWGRCVEPLNHDGPHGYRPPTAS